MNFVQTQPGADPIVVKGHIPAQPAKVFEAWTVPDSVKQWFGYHPGTLVNAKIDLRPGGRWCFIEQAGVDTTTGFEGEYLTVESPGLLIFTWSRITDRSADKPDPVHHSLVEIRLSANGGGTDMTIVHSSLDDLEARTSFSIGWEAGATNLVAFITTQERTASQSTPSS